MREPTVHERGLMANVARSFAKSYSVIDVEDIEQTLYLRWYDKWDTFARYLDMPEDEKVPLLIRTFQTWGIAYCRAELAEFRKLHPQPDDAYYYSREQVKQMVPFVEDPIAWSSFARAEDDGQRKGKTDPAHGGNALAHYADLRVAWDGLHRAERDVLRLRYVDGVEYDAIAFRLDITPEYARKKVERALSHLQKIMGCDNRARRVMSNATAAVVTRREYEGA